jgi:signal transduction histidine kinase
MSGRVRVRLARWQREKPKSLSVTAAGMPYLLLAVLAALTLPSHRSGPAGLIFEASLSGFAAAWMLFMYTLHRGWRERVPHMAVFVAVLIVVTALLATKVGWFGFFTAVCFGYSRKLLRWPWQVAGAAGTAFAAATSQTSGVQGSPLFRVAIFAVALAIDLLLLCSLMWLLHERDEQIAQHRLALAELSEANERLKATITENEGLHQRLLVQAREAGIADERQRMAREIHDTLAQGLTGIVTQLQAAEQAAEQAADGAVRAGAGWRRHVAAATRLARESLTEARRSVHALRPEPLETAQLSEALSGVAERWSGLNGIPAQVTTTGTARPVQPEIEFALLRAAQEALANVAKHAHATRVGLTVSYMDNEVALDVRDDGVGFDPKQSGRECFGLVAMRERIENLSGTLQVESEPGVGTAISACVPTVSALAGS